MLSLRVKIEAGIVLLLIVSSSFLYIFYNKYKEEKEQKEGVEQLFSKKQAEVYIFKNKYGREVSRNNSIVLENKTIKQLVKDGNLQFLKEFEGLKKNYKNLEYAFHSLSKSVDSLHIHLKDSIINYVNEKGDTVKFVAKNWKKQDKWSKFDYKEISPDSAILKYEVDVPLDGVLYWKRRWFLGKKHYFSEMTSENPHVKIPELLELKVGRK
jgi:hypothetical protein